MKKNYQFLLVLVASLFFTVGKLSAQCALSSSYWGEMLPNSGATFVPYGPFGPGQYFQMPVLNGASYSVSTCGASINTQLTGYQGASPQIFYVDDNGPECAGTAASVTHVPNFSDYMNVQVSEYNCLPGGTASVTVNVRQNNNLMFTSPSTDMCVGEVRALTATPLAVGSAQPGSGNLGTFSGIGVSGTDFIAPIPAGASEVFTLTYSFGYCTTTQNITVYAAPSAAMAGSDQLEICGTTTTLQANAPAIGTGVWSIVSGTGTLTDPYDPNTTITGLTTGTSVTLAWTITNGPCLASEDQVTLIVEDVTDPVADILVLNDITAECEVTSLTAPTATDNCAGSLVGTHNATLPITNQGTTTVTWTFDDGNGNTTSQTQNVVISDLSAPVPDVAVLNTIVSCDPVTLSVPTAMDNCVGALTGSTSTSFPITASTVVTWTYDDGNGNTSTQTQTVTINSANATVTQAGATLTAGTSSAYQWLDCDNNYQIIAGETGASFTPLAITGNYAVVVTQNGCVDTSACFLVDYTAVDDLSTEIGLSIYPNPSQGKFTIELLGSDATRMELRIVDLQGRLVLSQELEQGSAMQTAKIDISEQDAGLYILDIINSFGEKLASERIVKE